MTNRANNHKKFIVVQFIALPFEGIDDYVCVPKDWVVIRRRQDQKVVVTYPKDEDRFITRDRVEREERCSDDWKFWIAEEKYQSDTFDDADFWIATRNDYGPSVMTPFQIRRMPLPRTTIKRPGRGNSQPQLETKRFKPSITKYAEPTGAVSHRVNKEPGISNKPATIEDGSLVIDIDEDDLSRPEQQSSENNDNENGLDINITAAENNLQDCGSSSWNFQPRIVSVRSLATTSNNQEPRADVSSNNGPSTSQHKIESIATKLYEKMKGKPSLVANHPAVEKKMRFENIPRNVAILLNPPKNPPNSVNQRQGRQKPKSLPTNRAVTSFIQTHFPIISAEMYTLNIENSYTPGLELNSFDATDRMRETIRKKRAQLLGFDNRLVSPPILPRTRNSTRLTQETMRNTPSLLFPNLPDSIQQELLATHSEFLSNEEELQGHLAQGTLIIETHPDACTQTHRGEWNQVYSQDGIGRSPSPSDSRIDLYSNGMFDLGIPTEDELLVGTTNNDNVSQSNSRFISQMRGNSSGQASMSRNVAQEVPLVTEERVITATRSQNRNLNTTSRITLPPEYDPNDTRWTLKHHEYRPGLVELMPTSGIYVSYSELKFCEQTSSNCPSLVRRILLEVFSEKALRVCSSMTEKGHVRPKLDEHGCLILLNYILNHGFQRAWKTDMQPILKGLHDKVREIRF